MYKKAWCTYKVVVLLNKPIDFLPLSLPSSLLKFSITYGEGWGETAILRNLRRFSNQPPIHPSFLEMTPHLMAVQTTYARSNHAEVHRKLYIQLC